MFILLEFGLASSDDDNWVKSLSGNPVEEPEASKTHHTKRIIYI